MARYNTPVRDWTVKMPVKYRTRKDQTKAIMTLQQGVTMFSRKKKNGSKLASTPQIRHSVKGTTAKHYVHGCRFAFPPIKLV